MNLTAEQRLKIEQNKAAALLKKQQFFREAVSSGSHNHNTLQSNAREILVTSKFKIQSVKNNTNSNVESGVRVTFTIISEDRFMADTSYHAPSIEIFKTISGRLYDAALKRWSFPLSEHSNLTSKLRNLNPAVIVNAVPDPVIKSLTDHVEPESVDWSKIDKTLRETLLPFQVEGVRFGVGKKGRCMIADDMGLGKTIQALGIACYFRESWPLLIICPTSMRYPWLESIDSFLPHIKPRVHILTSGRDCILNHNIVITSYDLMKNASNKIVEKKFKFIIFDESHLLKSHKSARTKVALKISQTAAHVILLSGTPALSRPQELYSQICIIDPGIFPNLYDFGIRYCNGRKDKFGWNFSGSSNLEELEVYLKKKIMIRRLKSDVLTQLPSKIRKAIVLHPNMVKTITKQMQAIEFEYEKQKGAEKHTALLSFYNMTGSAKLNAVCEYIGEKLENTNKFLVFAHHANVLNGICELLEKKETEYIKIDGSVSSEDRQAMCQRFQNTKSCRVAVLSLKAANCGITLTEAQLVIFAELYWNPGELIQAEDRVHRIGQQDSVIIEYLLAKGTADDHIWRLVQSKLNTLNKVGLSKDDFKNTDTKHQLSKNQPTLISLFQKTCAKLPEKNCEELNENCDLKELVEDEEIFDNINLEEIENEYLNTNVKKRKTDTPFDI